MLGLGAVGVTGFFDQSSNPGDVPIVLAQLGVISLSLGVLSILTPLVIAFVSRSDNAGNVMPEEFRVLLVGDGYVGKTQLIRAISGDGRVVRGLERTPDFSEIIGPSMNGRELIFYDYRGQDFGYLEKGFDEYNLKGDRINAIIILVDLFSPPERDGRGDDEYSLVLESERDVQYDKLDSKRIRAQINRIGIGFIDVLFSKVLISTQSHVGLKGVCLFVNKADKWKAWQNNIQDERVLGRFEVIHEDLKRRCSDRIQCVAIVGSALKGYGVAGIDGLLVNLTRWMAAV